MLVHDDVGADASESSVSSSAPSTGSSQGSISSNVIGRPGNPSVAAEARQLGALRRDQAWSSRGRAAEYFGCGLAFPLILEGRELGTPISAVRLRPVGARFGRSLQFVPAAAMGETVDNSDPFLRR